MNSSVAAIHVNWAQSHHQSFSKRSTWALFCGKFCHFCYSCLIHLLVQNLQYILNVLNIFWTYVFNIFWMVSIYFERTPYILYRFSTFCTWSKMRFYLLKIWHLNMYDWRCTKYIECFLSQSNEFKYCTNSNKFCASRYIRRLWEIIYLHVDGSLKDSVVARRVRKGRSFPLKWDLRGHFWGYKLQVVEMNSRLFFFIIRTLVIPDRKNGLIVCWDAIRMTFFFQICQSCLFIHGLLTEF